MASALLRTPRLTGRRITADSAILQREVLTDPITVKALAPDGTVPSDEIIDSICERHLRHWAIHDFGLWQFFGTATEEFIGYCGVRNHLLRGAPEIELFYALRSPFFRRGYGTEMARAVVDVGFREVGAESIISFTSPDNLASRGVMTRIGMQFEGMIEHVGLPHVLYRLRREDVERPDGRPGAYRRTLTS